MEEVKYCNIRSTKETIERLKKLWDGPHDSYDKIINRLLDQAEKNENKSRK